MRLGEEGRWESEGAVLYWLGGRLILATCLVLIILVYFSFLLDLECRERELLRLAKLKSTQKNPAGRSELCFSPPLASFSE